MSAIISVGHDIIEISRIESAFQKYRQKFLHKVYTSQEIQYCLAQKNPAPSLAARFAVKEAVAKAFGCGIGRYFHWRSASTANDLRGAPSIHLDELGQFFMRQLLATNILVSLTHTKLIASAVVIIQ